MSRRSPLPLLLVAAALALLVFAAPASAARNCKLSYSEQRNLGASYVLKLSVKGVTCGAGKKVVKAFNACRRANGGADGRCNRRVRRFRCSENRFNQIATSYDSRVTCKRGSKRVFFTYTQRT